MTFTNLTVEYRVSPTENGPILARTGERELQTSAAEPGQVRRNSSQCTSDGSILASL
jgi:hypothetical protein